ncbi:hypothetical protein LCGC14_1805830 [marine sediment metagenome]|uniref:Uncharacterized protein n=1 Tax=marine sediment metagenome TaxID=412755 RepID=A0A0F9JMY5_9ZZZZ
MSKMSNLTTLAFHSEKKHSVRYDIPKGEDLQMSLYVPKAHPVLAEFASPDYPDTIDVGLSVSGTTSATS